MYDLLVSKHSIRFATKPQISPNVEIKFSKDVYDDAALEAPLKIMMDNKTINTSPLELQIAYKEEVLGSNKDLEDAGHLREIAKNYLNVNLLNEYKKKLRGR